MEILVTGGNGFVGRHLAMALLERGDRVRVLALPQEDTSWLEERHIAVYRGNVCELETLPAPMQGAQGVVHLAAMMAIWRPIDEYRAVNVSGTENVCRGLAAGISRFVHVSSCMAYGTDLGRPVHEDFPLTPLREPYAVSKAEGDKAVQRMIVEDGLPAVIIRPATVFGPGDRLNFGRMADRLHAGKGIIIGSGRNAVSFVYVTDLVQGLLLALDHERAVGRAYNITNDRPLSQEEFLRAIAQETGARPPRLHMPYHALYAAAYAAERLAMVTHYRHQPVVTRHGVTLFGTDNRHAIDRARRELGYAPAVAMREGVRLAASWYRRSDSSAVSGVPAASNP